MTHATMIENLAPSGHDPRHIEAIMRLRNPTLVDCRQASSGKRCRWPWPA